MPPRQSRTWKDFFASRWYLLVGIILLGLILLASVRAFWQSYEVQAEINRLQAEAAQLQAEQFAASSTLEYVKSPAYVEDKARTELNLVQNGEHVAIIAGDTAAQPVVGQGPTPVVESNQPSNPQLWWNYFFGPRSTTN